MNFSADVLEAHLAPLIAPTGPVALAVALSGGADSAALGHALAERGRADPRLTLRALHVDHGLGPAASALAAAATGLAASLGIPLKVLTVTVATDAGDSLEAAARAARYAALAAELGPGESLLTAHHLEDQAETLLLQLLRGAGTRGLAAMPASATLGGGRLLRPLLAVPRAALRAYASGLGLPIADDPMNHAERYERAYLRAKLWPALTARWPAAATTLARAAGHAAEAQALLDDYSAERVAALASGAGLSIEGLLALSAARRGEVIRHWLSRQGLRAPPARRQAQIDAELLGARGRTGPRMAWDGAELRTFAGFLYAFAPLATVDLGGRTIGASAPESLSLGALGRLEVQAAVGAGLRAAPGAVFTLGARVGGEELRLRHGGPRRALKDLLREARLPPWARERAILVHGAALAAVVLPHATWIAAEHAAGPGEGALSLAWRDAPPALRPAGTVCALVEREPPFR